MAAEELFLEHGAATPFEDVAKRANVGIGTLYRRFPSRDALLAAMCDERLMAVAQASRTREGALDLVKALRIFTEDLVKVTNLYKGLAALLGAVLRKPTAGCDATTKEAARLLRKGKAAGVVRKDFSVHDLVCVITAVSLATVDLDDAQPRIAHLVDMFLSGCLIQGDKGN